MFAPDPVFASALGITPSAPARVAPTTSAPARALIDAQVTPMAPAKAPVQVAAKNDAENSERCVRVSARLAALAATKASVQTPGQATANAPVQTAPKVPVQVPNNDLARVGIETTKASTLAPASNDNQAPLKPPAVRGVQRVPEKPTSYQGHGGVSNSHVMPQATRNFSGTPENPVSRPGNDVVSTAQVNPPPADSYPENTSSMIGNQPGPPSGTDAPTVSYYQDENVRPVVKLPVSLSDATVGIHQQELPQSKPKPNVHIPATSNDGPVVTYYQDEPYNPKAESSISAPSSDGPVIGYYQSDPPQPKRKINTSGASAGPPVIAYYQDKSYDSKSKINAPVASSNVPCNAPVVSYYQDEPYHPKPKITAPVASSNAPGNVTSNSPVVSFYQDEPSHPKPKNSVPVAPSETSIMALHPADPPRAIADPPADMMDTTPDMPQKITANQSHNILQSQVGQSSGANSQPTVIYYQDDHHRPSAPQAPATRLASRSTPTTVRSVLTPDTVAPQVAAGTGAKVSTADDLMDVDEKPAITGNPVLATADTQQATGKKCTCPKKRASGLGTSRWAAPAVKEVDPISATCPVHRPSLRASLLPVTAPSFPPIASSLSPTASSFSLTASSFFPLSENAAQISPGGYPAASASVSVQGQSAENVLSGPSNDKKSGPVSGPPGPWFL